MTAGHFRLGSAETGELGFRFLSKRVSRHNCPDEDFITKTLFELIPHWEADLWWKKVLGIATRKPYRVRVAHDCRWVKDVAEWVDSASRALVDKELVVQGPFPRRGGCLQPELPGLVVKSVQTRMHTVLTTPKDVIGEDEGIPELRSL